MTTPQRVSRMERHVFGDDQQTTATWPEIKRAHWAATPLGAKDDPCGREFLASTPRWKLRKYARLFSQISAGYHRWLDAHPEHKKAFEARMAAETPPQEKPSSNTSTYSSPVLSGSEEISPPSVSQEERELLDRLHGVGRWGVIWGEYPNRHNIDLDPRPPDPSLLAKDVSPVNETKRPAEPGQLDQPITNMYISPDLREQLDRQYGAGRWRYVYDPDLYAVLQVDPESGPSAPKKNNLPASKLNRRVKQGKLPRDEPDEIRAGSRHARGLNRKDGAGGRGVARDPNPGSGATRVDPKRPAKKVLDAHPERKDLVDGETSTSTPTQKNLPATPTTCSSPVLSGELPDAHPDRKDLAEKTSAKPRKPATTTCFSPVISGSEPNSGTRDRPPNRHPPDLGNRTPADHVRDKNETARQNRMPEQTRNVAPQNDRLSGTASGTEPPVTGSPRQRTLSYEEWRRAYEQMFGKEAYWP